MCPRLATNRQLSGTVLFSGYYSRSTVRESQEAAASPGAPGCASNQALDQVHNRVRAALLAQEVVRVVDDAKRLVRLHVVAVDDPLERAAARNRITLRLGWNARQCHVVVVLQAREVLIAAPQLRETHLALADPVALPRVRRRVQARLLLHRRIRPPARSSRAGPPTRGPRSHTCGNPPREECAAASSSNHPRSAPDTPGDAAARTRRRKCPPS